MRLEEFPAIDQDHSRNYRGAYSDIVFGLLFLLFLPTTISEISTDAIFIGAGGLIFRKAVLDKGRKKYKIGSIRIIKRIRKPKTEKKKMRMMI